MRITRCTSTSFLVIFKVLYGIFYLVISPTLSFGEERYALIIGNANYKQSPLDNAIRDAKAMADILQQQLDFKVSLLTDGNQKTMLRAMVTFGKDLSKGRVGLFYYAGHALQVDGNNYLVPVDAEVETEGAVSAETVAVNIILEQMARADNWLNIVILDACRNNPFEKRFRKRPNGLAMMDAPKGTWLAYSTAPGKVASDGTPGGHSLYTNELLKNMIIPGLRLEDIFKRVRASVNVQTGGSQIPWEASSLVSDFYFLPLNSPTVTVPSEYGNAIIQAASADVVIFIDGIERGRGPLLDLQLKAGSYQVVLRDRNLEQQLDLVVKAGQTTVLAFHSSPPGNNPDKKRQGSQTIRRPLLPPP